MEKINSVANLRQAILQLESKRAEEEQILRTQFHTTCEGMKPINLIKNTFKDAAASPDLKNELINTSIGLAAGYVSKKLFEDVLSGPVNKLVGTALMFGVTKIVVQHPDAIKSLGAGLFKMVIRELNGRTR